MTTNNRETAMQPDQNDPFTQGEWFVDPGDSPEEILVRASIDSENFDICSFACDETGNPKSNAALIAQSKNMYHSLEKINEECLKCLYDYTNNNLTFDKCKQIFGAIATTAQNVLEKANPKQ